MIIKQDITLFTHLFYRDPAKYLLDQLRTLGDHSIRISLLEEGKIEMGHARALLTLSEEDQLECAKRVISESLSVRGCEAMVSGLSGAKKKEAKLQTPKDPNTALLEKELSETLGSPVEIKHNKKGSGKITVRYKNLEVLEGLLDKLKS